MIKKFLATMGILATMLVAVPSAPSHADTSADELYTYGVSGNITTWLKVGFQGQADGTGTRLESATVDTVAYCSFLNETGNKYVGFSVTVRRSSTGTLLKQWNWGSETTCRSWKDLEWAGPDEARIDVMVTAVACVRGISGVQSGNDQQISAEWRLNGFANPVLLGRTRYTNNQSLC